MLITFNNLKSIIFILLKNRNQMFLKSYYNRWRNSIYNNYISYDLSILLILRSEWIMIFLIWKAESQKWDTLSLTTRAKRLSTQPKCGWKTWMLITSRSWKASANKMQSHGRWMTVFGTIRMIWPRCFPSTSSISIMRSTTNRMWRPQTRIIITS